MRRTLYLFFLLIATATLSNFGQTNIKLIDKGNFEEGRLPSGWRAIANTANTGWSVIKESGSYAVQFFPETRNGEYAVYCAGNGYLGDPYGMPPSSHPVYPDNLQTILFTPEYNIHDYLENYYACNLSFSYLIRTMGADDVFNVYVGYSSGDFVQIFGPENSPTDNFLEQNWEPVNIDIVPFIRYGDPFSIWFEFKAEENYSNSEGVYIDNVNLTCTGKLRPPANLTASEGIVGSVELSWDKSPGANYYRVYRNTTSGSSGASAVSNWISTRNFSDNQVTPNTTYYYWIKAATSSSGDNASDFSNMASGSSTEMNYNIGVTAPSFTSNWTKGGSYTILWNDNVEENVKIELFNNSTFISTITSSTTSDGSYDWTVPTTLAAGTSYRIKITSTTNSSISSFSDLFTISDQKAIEIWWPLGATTWIKGESYDIFWEDNLTENVKIELYNTAGFYRLLSSSTSSSGLFGWTVPTNIASASDYRVKITSTVSSSIYAYSEQFSIIDDPYIIVNNPTTSSSWKVGEQYSILWNDNIAENVMIQIWNDSDHPVSLITSSTASVGSYAWTVPKGFRPDGNYRIRVTSTKDSNVYGFSEKFTIYNPSYITISEPNENTVWRMGDEVDILWEDNSDDPVRIRLYMQGEGVVSTISNSTSANGIYKWTIPTTLTQSEDYLIEIVSTTSLFVWDFSEPFAILVPAVINITAPNASTVWTMGERYVIQWNDNIDENIRIELCDEHDNPVTTISSSAPGNGLFYWTIPKTLPAGNNYRIRISGTETTSAVGYSAPFTLLEAPYINVLAPEASTSWKLGAPCEIRWESNVGSDVDSYVDIYLYRESLPFDVTAWVSAPNTGSFNWTIPGDIEPAGDYYILIGTNPTPEKTVYGSSEIFSIVLDQTITINSPDETTHWISDQSRQRTVRWSSNGVGFVRLDLYEDDQPVYQITEHTDNNGEFSWYGKLPDLEGRNFRVKVTSIWDDEIFGFSEYFIITAQYPLLVTSPAEDIEWSAGVDYMIEWTDRISDYVEIDLIIPGLLVVNIGTSVPNTGSYLWTVPKTLVSSEYYWIRITSSHNETINDSNQFTIINPPSLSVEKYIIIEGDGTIADFDTLVEPGEFHDIYIYLTNNSPEPISNVCGRLKSDHPDIRIFSELACINSGRNFTIDPYETVYYGAHDFHIYPGFEEEEAVFRLELSGSGYKWTDTIIVPVEIHNPCAEITEIDLLSPEKTYIYESDGIGAWNTEEGNGTCHDYYHPGEEKIYRFTAPASGLYSIIAVNTGNYDYVNYSWKAGGCDKDGWQCLSLIITPGEYGPVELTEGEEYHLLLDYWVLSPKGTHEFYLTLPIMEYTIMSINDNIEGAGNGNGIPESGETFEISVRLKNNGNTDLQNVSAILTTTDPDVTILESEVVYNTLEVASEANGNRGFKILLSGDFETRQIPFRLQISTERFGKSFEFDLPAEGKTRPCDEPISITGFGPATSYTYIGGADGIWGTSACGFSTPGKEQVYYFDAPEQGAYYINVTQADEYVSYSWKEGSCASEGWTCIAGINEPGVYGPIDCKMGERYYLLLDIENNKNCEHEFYITQGKGNTGSALRTTGPPVFSVLPTVNDGKFHIVSTGNGGEVYTFRLTDNMGRTVYSKEFNSKTLPAYHIVSELKDGIYIYSIIRGQETVQTGKMVILQ
jgi:hypothetical protein